MGTRVVSTRRDVLRHCLITAAGIVLPGAAWAESCLRTPRQEEGPFYMNHYNRFEPFQNRNDLMRVPGSTHEADGDPIWVSGQITDWECRPIEGAVVEIWQACASGRYAHFRDPNPAPLDPYFAYSGEFRTGANGEYSFRTLKPGGYPVGPSLVRPPHIHFKITGGMAYPIFTTQMYFAGGPLNAKDPLLNSAPKDERNRLIIEPGVAGDGHARNVFRFNVTLSGYRSNQRRD